MRIRLSFPVLLLVTGCVAAPPPPTPPVRPVIPPPVAALPPPVPLASDWRDWPQTAGAWVYRQEAHGSVALFGPPFTEADFMLRCDAVAHRLELELAGETATPVTIRTTSMTRTLSVRPGSPAGLSYLVATLSANDPLLDAIGFSRGRFTVGQAGQPPLVLPAWAEVERVTEDCRG